MDLFLIADDYCGGLGPVVGFIRHGVFPILQIGIPILLILMGTIDLGRAVLSSDDKEIKAATGRLIKRAIAAIAVFFVVTIVSVITNMFAHTGDADMASDAHSWSDCWNNV